ncbi:MAG: hypothetical protein Alis3KO_21690 [Aliiglaciecola sp.]|uniref:flagellar basal body P-ring formation chaperone FlgA n=1 Tax=Aliiglaciecola sp. M165 TaxID=2593649 RepID=UPI00117D0838|nr:flagellar basal body P-ring formation chaperone FlgA [Aliiglaciecola sp. M165]TRY30905.1 flagellar basal body P-ring formation protein FlgA [Aliiglaciecola sp. M165]
MKKLTIELTIRRLSIATAFCSLFLSLNVTASEEKNLAHQSLTSAVEEYVFQQLSDGDITLGNQLTVKATPLDDRIQVPNCASPFIISASQEALKQSNITVRASCPDNNWYLYLMVKASRVQPVVVLTRAVGPGTVLNEQNVKIVMMDKNLIRTSTYSNIDTIVGARMKKRSRPGSPIVPGQLCFVCKGDNIAITADAGGVNIRTSGIAQQDGNLGDTIAVKNSKSKKLVHAQVVDTRQVKVQI